MKRGGLTSSFKTICINVCLFSVYGALFFYLFSTMFFLCVTMQAIPRAQNIAYRVDSDDPSKFVVLG